MIKDKRFWIVFLVVLTLFSLGYDVFFREPEPVRVKAAPTAVPSTKPSQASPSPANVAPYVGMIVTTVPSSWQWKGIDTTSFITRNGDKVQTTKYQYETTTRTYTIWVEKTTSKIVKVTYSERIRSTPRPSPRKSVAPTPDVSDFSHAEDFYDWYYDDFDDYENAEDWYEEHGGW